MINLKRKEKIKLKKAPRDMIWDLTQDGRFRKVKIKGEDKRYLKKLMRRENKRFESEG